MTRAGFVALIGAPNAGKSTLMNGFVGHKISIVTPKVQTTRACIRGIVMQGGSQIIFIDTPGIFAPKRRLDRAMVRAAWQGAGDSDVVMLIHDAARSQIDTDTSNILAQLKKHPPQVKTALVLNKIDRTTPEQVIQRAGALAAQYEFDKVFMVSATKAKGTDDILKWLGAQMPEGAYLYDPDDLSDLPERLLAAEVLREKLFLNLHQELPYQLTVETDSWQERDDGSVEVRCSIYVAHERHRGIILGAKGKTLSRIGQGARRDLEAMFGRKVHLFNHVKYRKNWLDDPARYRSWGLDFEA